MMRPWNDALAGVSVGAMDGADRLISLSASASGPLLFNFFRIRVAPRAAPEAEAAIGVPVGPGSGG
jgi:hypothetical protein